MVKDAADVALGNSVARMNGVYNKIFGMDLPVLTPNDEDSTTGYDHSEEGLELNIYYFHPDHLGSSAYISNASGNASQHMEYLPFGETLVDEHLNSFSSPFKYNGKELDEETGNYYYGARYYDPKWSIFISVDPLAEKTMDAYGYCYQNPVKFTDPTGMAASENDDPIYNRAGEKIGDDGKSNGTIHVVFNKNEAKEIYNKTINGDNSIDMSSYSYVTLFGGDQTVSGVLASVDAAATDTSIGASDAGLHEEGGHSARTQNGVISVAWKPGPKRTGTNHGSIALFNGVQEPPLEDLLDYWHVHTSKSIRVSNSDGTESNFAPVKGPSGVHQFGKPLPKKGDIIIQGGLESRGFKGTAIQIDGGKNGNVNFYNSSGVINTMSTKAFKKLRQ